MANILTDNPLTRFYKNIVGPAAIVAAGMIGAGAVATRLLAGAWFGFELLWAALYVIPMVIFANDSASRVGILSGHRGMIDMVKKDISPILAWGLLIPLFLQNVIVNVAQVSVLAEATYGIFGIQLIKTTMTYKIIVALLTGITLAIVLFGGFKRITKVMTNMLLLILFCFIIVAVKGLMNADTWLGLFSGLIPRIPQDVAVLDPAGVSTSVRSGFTQLMAISGQALACAVFLSYGYFTSNAEYTEATLKENFKRTVRNFGYIWGTFSVVVVVCGVTALHYVYTGMNGQLHWSQIDSIAMAGQVITPALPSSIGFLAPRIFSLGLWAAAFTTLVSVAMTMTYFMLDLVGRNWKYTPDNKAYRVVLSIWIIVPAILTPFWSLPSLIQSIIAMAGNLFLTPLVILIIMIFINKKSLMGKYKANTGRNIVLACTLLFSLFVVVYGVQRFIQQF